MRTRNLAHRILLLSITCLLPFQFSFADFNPIERASQLNNIGGDSNSLAPALSTDNSGRYVVFESDSTNLVANDSNALTDVFVLDRTNGTITRVSKHTDGTQSNGDSKNGSISSDGRYVVFESSASNIADNDSNGKSDVFLHDLTTGTTTLVSKTVGNILGNDDSSNPSITDDGAFVAFESTADNLVSNDDNKKKDVFVVNRGSGAIELVKLAY